MTTRNPIWYDCRMGNVTTVTNTKAVRGLDTNRKARLLEAITDHVLAHGLNDLSLRPLAGALGTSARMLIYYFGSKERLIVQALESARAREQQDLILKKSLGYDEVLRRYWEWSTAPANRSYLRLVYQVYGLALHDRRYSRFFARDSADWARFCDQGLREAGVPEDRLPALSTFLVASVRGLELDLLGTDDVPRIQAAFEVLVEDLFSRVSRYACSKEFAQ